MAYGVSIIFLQHSCKEYLRFIMGYPYSSFATLSLQLYPLTIYNNIAKVTFVNNTFLELLPTLSLKTFGGTKRRDVLI